VQLRLRYFPVPKTLGGQTWSRSLAIYKARLGADHPATVRSRQDLAALDEQQ
jgi:hypothetical protein